MQVHLIFNRRLQEEFSKEHSKLFCKLTLWRLISISVSKFIEHLMCCVVGVTD